MAYQSPTFNTDSKAVGGFQSPAIISTPRYLDTKFQSPVFYIEDQSEPITFIPLYIMVV